ncbi:MAG: winged helix-turn-helix domain-containing protein [Phycisphaerales bacterium]|nr:winged helix-turn-helix domain-containing protein [Phycisphaerales bacterium]
MAQSILLPATMNATLEQTAQMLGVSRATVPRLQSRFRQSQMERGHAVTPRSWGGRRRELMSLERERTFLKPWMEQAKRGQMLVVSPLRAALSQELGRPVRASVVYRMLARHGWRKVAPDTRHPKNDPCVQADWKKVAEGAGRASNAGKRARSSRAADVPG